MSAPDRRPLAPMESREPHSIRFTPNEWALLAEEARRRGLEPAVFVRQCAMYGFSIIQAPAIGEVALGMPPQVLRGARGSRRF